MGVFRKKNQTVWAPFWKERPYVLLDGALASELEGRGFDLRDALWSAAVLWKAPEAIEAIHRDYFRAGADVAVSATYQASLLGFMRRGMSRPEAEALLMRGLALALRARHRFWEEAGEQGPQLVAASVGPYGAYLADGSEYHGHYGLSPDTLRDFHLPRLELLCRTEADLLALETLPGLGEAELLLRLLEELGNPVCYLSMSCRNERETRAGDPIESVAQLAEAHPSVQAVGVNCTAPGYLAGLLARMKPHTRKPLLAYPNSGEDWDANRKCWTGHSAWHRLEDWVQAAYAAGGRILGGCCRTGPADIRAMKVRLDQIAAAN